MDPRRGAVNAGVASFSKVIRTSGTRSVRVVGCTRCFPTRPASVPKLDSEGPQRYRCRECGCRSVSKLAGVTRLLSDFLIPHFKLSHYPLMQQERSMGNGPNPVGGVADNVRRKAWLNQRQRCSGRRCFIGCTPSSCLNPWRRPDDGMATVTDGATGHASLGPTAPADGST